MKRHLKGKNATWNEEETWEYKVVCMCLGGMGARMKEAGFSPFLLSLYAKWMTNRNTRQRKKRVLRGRGNPP